MDNESQSLLPLTSKAMFPKYVKQTCDLKNNGNDLSIYNRGNLQFFMIKFKSRRIEFFWITLHVTYQCAFLSTIQTIATFTLGFHMPYEWSIHGC
jgi:hypothetical protein